MLVRVEVPPNVALDGLGDSLDQWFSGLVDLLSQRRVKGACLRKLRIVGCWGSVDMKQRMQDWTDAQLARVSQFVEDIIDERVCIM